MSDPKTETPPVVPPSVKQFVLERIRLRLSAIYHTCMSQACFKMEDSWKAGADEMEALACRREGRAFEEAAGWVKAAVDELPK